jgi:hypothetical protein
MTRRELAMALGSAAGVAALDAQTPPAGQPEDLNTAAQEQLRKNREALAQVELPMSTEPAFQFKA